MNSQRSGELRLIQGGASNSRLTATSGRATRAGFDTVRFRLRCPSEVYEGFEGELYQRGEKRRSDGGVTVGAYPDGLVTVEGRLAALLYGEEDHRLCGPDELLAGESAAAAAAGVDDVVEIAGVGRCDLASELSFKDGAEGLALLRAFAALDVPWLKTGTEGSKRDGLETVFWRSMRGRSIVLRLYDKGVESGTAAPGERLRLERQRRYRKTAERTVAQLLEAGPVHSFVGRELAELVLAERDVVVCNRLGAIAQLQELVQLGRVGVGVAAAVSGWLLFEHVGSYPARTARRHAARLRQLGIALDDVDDVDQAGELKRFPVSDYLRQFVAAFGEEVKAA